MKNNIEFYQHYASADQHPKFKMLRVKYGWAGEGQFWALNNRIAQADKCCLNIAKKYNKSAVASDLGFTLQEFDAFLQYLLQDCELVRECEEGVITTDIIQENYQRVNVDRAKARKRSQRRYEKQDDSPGEDADSSGEDAIKVKESKGKKELTAEEPAGDDQDDNVYKTKKGRSLSGKRLSTFLSFWDSFNYKRGKAEAADIWVNLPLLTDNLVTQICSAAKIEAQSREEMKAKGKTPKMAEGWLSGRRWEDEAYSVNSKNRETPEEILEKWGITN